MIVKTDNPRYHRDTFSKAILATDQRALLKHRQKVSQTNMMKSNEDEINTLRSYLEDLKWEKEEDSK